MYTPHTAWVQTFGKQPRIIRNSEVALVPNPLINKPCTPSRLSDYVANKSARRSGPCLRFLDIEQPNAPQHPMFKEDTVTGLLKRLTRKEQAAGQQSNQSSPNKRRTKPTGKRTGGHPTHKTQRTRGMSLQTEEKNTTRSENKTPEKSLFSEKDDEEQSSAISKNSDVAKRFNQKRKPPTVTAEPTRRLVRNRQSTLANALGNPVP